MNLQWSDAALDDLNEAYDYIAKDSVRNANRWRVKVLHSASILGSFPYFGKIFEEEVREYLVHPNYKVYYKIFAEEKKVVIGHFRHAQRLPPELDAIRQ
jgi:plasmid stabilization system protein ParE